MKLLFVGPIYPGTSDQGFVSGIAVYLRNIAEGLTAAGHECHVLVWGNGSATKNINGVIVHTMEHSYWPILERWMPESRDVFNLTKKVLDLDSRYHFDWIEIESDEGQGIGIQKKLPEKVILRLHTTLAQMVDVKQVEKTRKVRYRLRREAKSVFIARHVLAASSYHAGEIKALFCFCTPISIMHLGIQDPLALAEGGKQKASAETSEVLIVGTPDLRKGFDRIRQVLDAYAARFGSISVRIVSPCSKARKAEYSLVNLPGNITITWMENLDEKDLYTAYLNAGCLLHLARYESFCYPLVEAAAMSLPVVATDVGIAGELLKELPQFIVDGDNPEKVAGRLHEACLQKERVGKVLRAAYLKGFTADIMVQNYLKVLAGWCDAADKGLEIRTILDVIQISKLTIP